MVFLKLFISRLFLILHCIRTGIALKTQDVYWIELILQIAFKRVKIQFDKVILLGKF